MLRAKGKAGGGKVESLNVSVAAAVLIWELLAGGRAGPLGPPENNTCHSSLQTRPGRISRPAFAVE